MQTKRFISLIVAIFFIIPMLLLSCTVCGDKTGTEAPQAGTYRIGVLLPASGDSDMDFYETLNWTVAGLGKEGLDVELVCEDTSVTPIMDAARKMLNDPGIRVVIGPATSDEVFSVAPEFIAAKKILITPSATSEEIADRFGRSGYIWRTTSGDRIQTRIIMDLLARRGAESVALLYENNTYGKTFADWAEYYAKKSGVAHSGSVAYAGEQNLSYLLAEILSKNPDYLIVAARGSVAAETACLTYAQNSTVRLFFTDAARCETFLTNAGESAEGAEGVSPTADKKTGFFVAYQKTFERMPSDYAAPARDALALGIATLARLETKPTKDPKKAIVSVVQGRDMITSWDDQGTAQAVRLIRAGYLPDLSGASGPLDYDTATGTDPIQTWYVHWRVEEGEFLADSYIPGYTGEGKNQDPGITPVQNGSVCPDPIKDPRTEISFVYNGAKGDFGFTDQAYLGILRARDDLNLTVHEIFTGDTENEPDPVLNPITGKNAGTVVMLGSSMTEYAERIAKQYPDIPVIVIDADPVSLPGIKTVSFFMHGASYLAGRLAANQTKTGQVGVIAGRKAQVIDSFTDGFVQGATDEDPRVLVHITYIADDNSGYQQPEKGAAIARDMYRNGTDIIFTVAGESGLGAISAAKELPDLKIIGVDCDQSYLGPGVVIASVIKNLDLVVYRELTEALNDNFTPGLALYNLSNDGARVAVNPRFDTLSKIVESRIKEAVRQED
ncbi:MAG: BMP family ABC transporter substrate-binding protein [Methanospirillaceae archaeon]|nr:BMP family ABC transporter substrate-binding protein [Methanospirillaceae archaeon]